MMANGEYQTGSIPVDQHWNGLNHEDYIGAIIGPKAAHNDCSRILYPYQLLPTSTSVRLLKVNLPDEVPDLQYGWAPNPLSFTMVTRNLDDLPSYTAISYAWGDPKLFYRHKNEIHSYQEWDCCCYGIQIDGGKVTVSANLFEALLAVQRLKTGTNYPRHSDMQHDLEYLWVDALCISQTDLGEKSSQVQLMKRIYSQSQRVIVWLGGNDFLAQTALEVLGQLTAKLEEAFLGPGKYRGLDLLPEMPLDDSRFYDMLDMKTHISIRKWSCIYAFLNRSWFRRAWVVQEFGLPRKVHMVCGLSILDDGVFNNWMALLSDMQIVSKLEALGPLLIHDAVLDEAQSARKSLWQESPKAYTLWKSQEAHDWCSDTLSYQGFIRSRIQKTLPSSEGPAESPDAHFLRLSENSLLFRSSEATDPRDKLYALLGISRRDTASSSVPIVPDYTQTTEVVYEAMAKRMIEDDGDLAVLSMVEDAAYRKLNGLASWVPDFSTSCKPIPLRLSATFSFHADRGLGTMQVSFPRPKVMSVFGFELSTISHTAHVKELEHGGVSSIAKFVAAAPRVMGVVRPYSTQADHVQVTSTDTEPQMMDNYLLQSRLEVYSRTVVTDRLEEEFPAPDATATAAKIHMRRCISSLAAATIRDFSDVESYKQRMQNVEEESAWLESMLLPGEMKPMHQQLQEAREKGGGIIQLNGGDFGPDFPDEWLDLGDSLPWDATFEAKYMHQKERCIKDRKLIVLTPGGLGLAPRSVEVGDKVWILAGSRVPVVLRHIKDQEYKLIGEAYIHGVMYGLDDLIDQVATRHILLI